MDDDLFDCLVHGNCALSGLSFAGRTRWRSCRSPFTINMSWRNYTGCLVLFVMYLSLPIGLSSAFPSSTTIPKPLSALPNVTRISDTSNSNNSTVREAREIQCLAIRHTFGSSKSGLDGLQVPRRAINGDHLTICSQESTCCTQEMEHKLSTLARADYERLFGDHVNRFKALLIARTTRFDDFFTELIRNARHSLDSMFSRTYGTLYEKNKVIFTDLFDSLELYYRGNRGRVDLQQTMNHFFSSLFQKMFSLINFQYALEKSHNVCISRLTDKIKPFGDSADRLTLQIRRAFVDARTFVQALAIGRDTLRTASEIPVSQQCTHALTKMMYCPQCRGLKDLKPCSAYCLHVMKACLVQHVELESEWNQYIDALLMLADRLRSPVNIETVVVPLDVKISEAIMNLQEQAENVSIKVFAECGKPRLVDTTLNRAKRAMSDPGAHNRSALPPTSSNHGPSSSQVALPSGHLNLEQLSKDIKEKLLPTKDFWSSLPSQLCTDYAKTFKNPVQEDCWNGMTKSKSSHTSAAELAAGPSSPKLTKSSHPDSTPRSSAAVGHQIQQLKLVTSKLKQAINNGDVEWIETVSDDEPGGDDEDQIEPEQGSGDSKIVEGSGEVDPRVDKDAEPDSPDDEIEGSGKNSNVPGMMTSTGTPVTHEVRIHPKLHTTTPKISVPPAEWSFETTSTTTAASTTTTSTTIRTTTSIKSATLPHRPLTPLPKTPTRSTSSKQDIPVILILLLATGLAHSIRILQL